MLSLDIDDQLKTNFHRTSKGQRESMAQCLFKRFSFSCARQIMLVFFDITVGNTEIGRILIEFYAHSATKTAEIFRQFCMGEYKKDSVACG